MTQEADGTSSGEVMALEVAASAADCDDAGALPRPPPPPSSSLRSSASSHTSSGSSSSFPDAGVDPEEVATVSSSSSSCAGSTSSSGSGSSALGLSTVGDSSANASASASASVSSCADSASVDSGSDWADSDKCRYYPPREDGCTEPRSCRDCLNVAIDADYGCMVNQYGRCLQKNVGSYVGYMDFRVQMPANYGTKDLPDDQKVQFPSDAATYCDAADKKCEHCKQTAFADVIGGDINGSLTRFCYGEDGCVCIAFCEAPAWNTTVGRTVCNGVVVNKAYDSQNAHKADGDGDGSAHGVAGLILEIFGGVAAVVALVVFAQWARKRRHSSASSSSSGSDDANVSEDGGENEGPGGPGAAAGSVAMAVPVSTPGLSLFGWQAMRSELIEREQLLLAGVEDFSNVRTGYLQLLDVDASAPPHEEDDSSAPVLLVPLAGASAPSFSPRGVTALASAPSAPPSTRMLEEELL